MKFRKWFLIATLVFSCSFKVLAYEKELAICTVFQNEARWLKEWIEFHKIQGVEHFYLYNNLSTDNYKAVLDEYIKKGEVTLIQWPSSNNIKIPCWQASAIQHSIDLTVGKVKWLVVMDADEFLFSPKGMDLREYLKRFEKRDKVGGVCVNQQVFGTSGVKSLNKGELLMERLLFREPCTKERNPWVKTIVRPEYVSGAANSHHCNYKKGYFAVDSNFKWVKGNQNYEGPLSDIRINHYYLRSQEWAYSEKVKRYINIIGFNKQSAIAAIQRKEKNCNQEEDTAILIYAERLRKAMGF